MVDVPVEDESKYPPASESPQSEDESQTEITVPSNNDTAQNTSVNELSCQALWKARNQVFHDNGYCFMSDEALAAFDNNGCQFDKVENVSLSDAEKEYVKTIRATEESKGCTNKPTQTPNAGLSVGNEKYVQQMLEGSKANDEKLLETSRQFLENQPKPVKGDKRSARKLNDEGLVLFNAQQYEKASQIFEKANQLDPADIEILNNYGIALLKSNNLDRAWAVLVKVLTIKPDRAPAWANLGDILSRQGKEELAIAGYLNTYRFSKDRDKTHHFFQDQLAKENDDNIRSALTKTIQKSTGLFINQLPSN